MNFSTPEERWLSYYHALVNARSLLESLANQDGPNRGLATAILTSYPHRHDISWMLSDVAENHPNVRTRSPVEFSPFNGGWIFWDETWADFGGPFKTREDAAEACNEYAKKLETEKEP